MSQAIVDPGEIRRFAHSLRQFHSELQSRMGSLHSQMTALGHTWRDQEHRKFADEFEQTMKVLNRFQEACQEHIPFLLRKADRAEEYLEQR